MAKSRRDDLQRVEAFTRQRACGESFRQSVPKVACHLQGQLHWKKYVCGPSYPSSQCQVLDSSQSRKGLASSGAGRTCLCDAAVNIGEFGTSLLVDDK